MGKIVISTSKYREINFFFDFMEPSKTISVGNVDITAYRKLRIHTENFAQREDNWIIGVGTYIYKAKIDSAALLSILEDIESMGRPVDEAIEQIRKLTYGNYCFVLFLRERLYVFVDLCGGYKVYYYMGQDGFVLTNTWYHINQCLKNPVIDRRFVEYLCNIEAMDQSVPCENIFRLLENEILEFHTKWEIRNVALPKGDDEGDFWQSMEIAYREIASAIKEQGILFTGGQDSRLNLAMLLGVGLKPKLYYGIGNSRDTNTKKEDLECFEKAAQRFKLPSKKMNWKSSGLQDLELRIKELGEMAVIYNGNGNIYNEFLKEIDSKCVLLGYFGEWIRNNEYDVPEEFNLDYYMDHFYAAMLVFKACKKYPQYMKEVKTRLEGALQEYDIDADHIRQDDLTLLNYLVHYGNSTFMSNYINIFMYSYSLIPSYIIFRQLIKVSYQEKKNSRYLLAGIRKFCPETLEIPLYSRHTLRTINWDTMELSYTQNRIEGMRKTLKKYYVHLHRSFVRKLYFVLKGDQKGLAEFKAEKRAFKEFYGKISIISLVNRNFNMDKLRRYSDGTFLQKLYILLLLLNEEVTLL